MVIRFLVLWSIYLSSSLVHLKKDLEYLTRGTAQVFITLISFRLESFVSSSFLVLLWYSFWILFFISTCLMMSDSQVYVFDFLRSFYSCLDLVVTFRQLEFAVLFHFLQIVWCHPCTLWLIFFCNLLSLYPAVHFLSMWLSGIMAIMNNTGNSASPLKIPLWILVSTKLRPPAVNSTLQVLSINFITSCDILYILRQFIIRLCGTKLYALFFNPGHS